MGSAVAVALAIGYGLALGAHVIGSGFILACPWYLGLFALGMAAALRATRSVAVRPARMDRLGSIPALGLCVVVAAIVSVFETRLAPLGRLGLPREFVNDTIIGAATVCLILRCAFHARFATAGRPLLLRVLASRPLCVLGSFSYSLYLIHFVPILRFTQATEALGLSPSVRYWSSLLVAMPVIVALAYVISLLFERSFLSRSQPALAHGAAAALLQPGQV
jgi:peptidoglycan/LPS O-acetylase OafA/YrhL